MKILLKIVGGLVAFLVVGLLVLSATGLEPTANRPGLWIKGTPDTTPVADWSYTDQYVTVMIQTRPWYGLPHSVMIWCIAQGDQLYVATSGAATRSWPRDVARDPHVRLKIGERVYDQTLALVTDPAERAAVLESKRKKYPGQRVPTTSQVYLFRVQPGSPAA